MDTRVCSRCKLAKALEDFGRKDRGRIQPYCKPCNTQYQREWYEKNREKHKASMRVRGKAYRDTVRDLFIEAKNKPCADCGQSFPYYCMDFDHLGFEEKLFNIGAKRNRVGIPALLAEIAKCEVVCACCHRERTFSRLKSNKGPKL